MPAIEPQTRFLLRGSALLVGLLTLWWVALVSPMLYLLRGAAGIFLPIEEAPSGDWTIRVPLERELPTALRRPEAQRIQSVDFDLPRSDVITFTFSLPLFWAIMLAAPGVRRNFRSLLLGTALVSAVEVALLLAFAQIATSRLLSGEDSPGRNIGNLDEYLVVNVFPFILPLVAALGLHRELRADLLPFTRSLRTSPRPVKSSSRIAKSVR